MMRTIIGFVFLFFTTLSVNAQGKLIVLHSVVGDTIDKREQQEFILFSNILNQDFTSATIHCNDEKYVMHINSASGLKLVDIKEEDLVENAKHVEKLVRYFKTLTEKRDSLDFTLSADKSWPEFQSDILNDVQRKKIAIEARKYFDLNQDAESRGLIGLDKENYIKVNSKSFLAEVLFEILK